MNLKEKKRAEMELLLRTVKLDQLWWLKPVISATQNAEFERTSV
jgi:hypothetical protein